jgi:hypothetical protein
MKTMYGMYPRAVRVLVDLAANGLHKMTSFQCDAWFDSDGSENVVEDPRLQLWAETSVAAGKISPRASG